MKQNPPKSSTQPLTSEKLYEQFASTTNDWTEAQQLMDDYWMEQYAEELATGLCRPNPPTEEMIKKAQFVDKTYRWNGR
jgi:hypothetical protein